MDRLRVLTLNIWNRQGPWEQRLPLIRRGIEELQPDLVGLQEVLHLDGQAGDQATDIARDFGYHVAFGEAWDLGGGLKFGNAILSRWPIAEQQVWPLPNTPGEETRALLGVEIDAPCGRIPCFVTHLAWRLHQGALRVEQVRFVAERVLEAASKDKYPAILLGDFNAEPESDEIHYLRGWHAQGGKTIYLTDAYSFVHDRDAGYTFARRNPYALIAHEPNRRLDYVFVRGPDRWLRGEPLTARVVLDTPDDAGVFPSDHFGVYVELAAEKRRLDQ